LPERSTTAPDQGRPEPLGRRPPGSIGRALAGMIAGLVVAATGLSCEPAGAEAGSSVAAAGSDSSTADTARGDPTPGDLEAGRRLLAQYQCGRCHRIPGVEAATGDLAVPLDRLGRRAYLAGRVPNTPRLLAAWLVRPDALVPGTAMPDLGVSDAQARLMAGYLGSLR
jgi:cytochrome c